jgi:hypothetical protein
MNSRSKGKQSNESGEQIAVVSWFKLKYPKHHLIAIPNGQWIAGTGIRKFTLINKYKAEGLTNGVSDLFLATSKQGYHGLWLEMKDRGKKEKSLSESQKDWLNDMRKEGYKAEWAAGFDQAKEIIENYMKVK